MIITELRTAALVEDFYTDCRERGLSPNTIATTQRYLSHFAAENPALPITPESIEAWLRPRRESFARRGNAFSRIQMFYAFLVRRNILTPSPIPPGKIGRPNKPPKPKKPLGRPRKNKAEEKSPEISVGGGTTFTVTISGPITITISGPVKLPSPP